MFAKLSSQVDGPESFADWTAKGPLLWVEERDSWQPFREIDATWREAHKQNYELIRQIGRIRSQLNRLNRLIQEQNYAWPIVNNESQRIRVILESLTYALLELEILKPSSSWEVRFCHLEGLYYVQNLAQFVYSYHGEWCDGLSLKFDCRKGTFVQTIRSTFITRLVAVKRSDLGAIQDPLLSLSGFLSGSFCADEFANTSCKTSLGQLNMLISPNLGAYIAPERRRPDRYYLRDPPNLYLGALAMYSVKAPTEDRD